MSSKRDGLDNNWVDRTASIAKAGVSALSGAFSNVDPSISVAGAALNELINTMPGQRVDRLVRFARILEERLNALEMSYEELRVRTQTENFNDLMEDALILAARTFTDERREHIASLLTNSLTETALDHIKVKKLLVLLGSLNDAEIIVLQGIAGRKALGDRVQEYWEQHRTVLATHRIGGGIDESENRREMDRTVFAQAYHDHLEDLGLVHGHYWDTEFKAGFLQKDLKFDRRKGTLKPSSLEISELGLRLLEYIGLLKEE